MSCFDQVKEWLDIYFTGRDPGFFPKMHLAGSDFRNRVGEIMLEIPFGKIVTYGWIANRIAKERGLEKMSAQAVGGAVSHNPISIIVPCHRVVGANGNLTGYGGGIDRKIALLELEGNDMSQFKSPPPPGRYRTLNNTTHHLPTEWDDRMPASEIPPGAAACARHGRLRQWFWQRARAP